MLIVLKVIVYDLEDGERRGGGPKIWIAVAARLFPLKR
jgi:hypothetical protein